MKPYPGVFVYLIVQSKIMGRNSLWQSRCEATDKKIYLHESKYTVKRITFASFCLNLLSGWQWYVEIRKKKKKE